MWQLLEIIIGDIVLSLHPGLCCGASIVLKPAIGVLNKGAKIGVDYWVLASFRIGLECRLGDLILICFGATCAECEQRTREHNGQTI